jgi:hypothetical protein
MTFQFKVGNRLRVLRVAYEMEANGIKVGDVVTVTGEDVYEHDYRVAINGLDNGGLGFDEDRFELVAEFDIDDLKPCQRVTLANGQSGVVVPFGEGAGLALNLGHGAWNGASFYDSGSQYHIVEVYAPPHPCWGLDSTQRGELLYREGRTAELAKLEAAVKAATEALDAFKAK